MYSDSVDPCVYCSKPARISDTEGWLGIQCATPLCAGYRVTLGSYGYDHAKVIEKWNTQNRNTRVATSEALQAARDLVKVKEGEVYIGEIHVHRGEQLAELFCHAIGLAMDKYASSLSARVQGTEQA